MTSYRIDPDASDVLIHARSTVHPIEGRATAIGGTLDVDIADGQVTALRSARIEVPVRSLRSGNPLEDAELQRRVEARLFPTIAGEVHSATALGDGRFHVEGQLTFHGVTEVVAGEVRITADGDRVRVEGEQVFDVRRFGIKPPRILLLRVEPDVRVEIAVAAEPLPL